MKILWITNILFPEVAAQIGAANDISGGWMTAAAEALVQCEGVELTVASVSPRVKDVTKFEGERMSFYVLPHLGSNYAPHVGYEEMWRRVKKDVQPDVVHVHGTEFAHSYAYVKACGDERTVISIQGLSFVHHAHFLAGLSKRDIRKSLTLRDLLLGTMLSGQRTLEKWGAYEKEMLRKVSHVIGRTDWDRESALSVNPQLHYHFCNETLRTPFYDGRWAYENCRPHTIFLSQAGYALKGMHQVLKALPMILEEYPDTQIRVAGHDVIHAGLKSFMGYGKYLRNLSRQLNVEDRVTFTGPLSAAEMKAEYLRANVFVCPSSIENSPNSLGEAQLLGVPCVASRVGGIPTMIPNDACGKMYDFADVAELSRLICEAFAQTDFDNEEMRKNAARRHDGKMNADRLVEIYGGMAFASRLEGATEPEGRE